MNAYLYVWHPGKWDWVDLADAVCRVNEAAGYHTHWSCGNTRRINAGDVFFLMRLGKHPKGIVGCGYITSEPYEMTHWDAQKAKAGKRALRTDLAFKALADEPLLSLGELEHSYPGFNWTPQGGGTRIDDSIAGELFDRLANSATHGFEAVAPDAQQLFSEGKRRVVTTNTYDRSPRARQACIRHHGYDCAVCGFNFKERYGNLGSTFVEIHHLKPIAEVAEEHVIDPIRDLRPVCSNCHRMLHRRRPALAIDELLTHLNSLEQIAPSLRKD